MKYINTVLNYIIMLTACHQDILLIIVPTFELEVNIFLGGSAVFFLFEMCPEFLLWGTLLDAESKVQVTAPLINYQTTQIPLDLIER